MQQTPLFQQHQAIGAHMVDFHGWALPLHYGSQLQEHKYVREHVGMFDVSHMHVVEIKGDGVQGALRRLLANDVVKLSPGQAQYSLMLNEQGGIIDDLIVYALDAGHYRLVFNGATREAVTAWLDQQNLSYQSLPNTAIIAVQGPEALAVMGKVLPECADMLVATRPFHFFLHQDLLIARTGYTGEDGVEIIAPANQSSDLWQALLDAGVAPCGLGARDTLRLEAGMCLSGTDMDDGILPKQVGLSWVIDLKDAERDFIGRSAHEADCDQVFVGLLLSGKGIMRNGQDVLADRTVVGQVTSGGFSPTMGQSIALARLDKSCRSEPLHVVIRQQAQPVQVVKLPFVRHGQVLTNNP